MKSRTLLIVAAAFVLAAAGVRAQTFPAKPVKIILPFPAGTGPDTVMRLVGEKLNRYWGQQVIVENKPGANGWIAMDAAKRSTPDGYTLVQVDTPLMSLQPHLYKKLPYDPVKDFDPIGALYKTYYFVTVASDSKWKNVTDLVNAAKARPGEIKFGSSGNGGNLHLGGAMLETATGTKMSHIPYKETPQIYVGVSTSQIDWAFGTASTTSPMLKAGKVKYLAISSPKRHPAFPDVPTMAEAQGPSKFELKTWVALFAPRGTPKAIATQISADVARALKEADVQEKLLAVGFDPFIQSPDELQKTTAADSQMYKDLTSRLNISLD
jgi:tripartite-type tricarboxylate transporter receptor subunit TctC